MKTDPRVLRWLGSPALAMAVVACAGSEPGREPPVAARTEGTVWVARDTVVTDRFDASGTAGPLQRAELASRLMARVTQVIVREGDVVKAGQVLARLDARDLDARREQARAGRAGAEAALLEARTDAGRIRALYADSAAPRSHLDHAEATLARAEAGMRQAEAAEQEVLAVGEYAELRAPFRGTITRRLVDPGGFAAPGQPMLVIEDASILRIAVTAPAAMAVRVRRGDRLPGTIENRPVAAVVEGVVSAPGGSMVTVNATVRNSGQEWFPGSVATLALPLGTRRALLVPAAAVIREGDLTGVRVRRGAEAELRWVRLGSRSGRSIEVLTGLAPGDSVVVPVGSPE